MLRLHQEFNYGSHLPLLKTLVEMHQPSHVVEFGLGNTSTAFFLKNIPNVWTIENNYDYYQQWAQVQRQGFRCTLHDVKDIATSTHAGKLTIEQKQSICAYYQRLRAQIKRWVGNHRALLFVDHYASLRAAALVELHDLFPVIVWHDSECDYYCYWEFLRRFDHARYVHFAAKSFISATTDCLVDRSIVTDWVQFSRLLREHEEAYKETFGARGLTVHNPHILQN